jgi:pimeloyl-ACP methyl ester carboxylesterase
MRFLLIHGGFHGAWCWRDLIPQIERLGHEAIAIDLPGHGERRAEHSTLANRRDAIVSVMRRGDVLVGHSAGGFDITLAADAASEKVGHLVYLAAGVPIEGHSLLEALGGAPASNAQTKDEIERLRDMVPNQALRPTPDGSLEWVDKGLAKRSFYHDCDEALANWAFERLSPAPQQILTEPVTLPRFWTAALPRSYIVCLKDRVLPFAKALAFAGRLGVMPLYLDSSHSPFFSRPAELAAVLVKAAATRAVAALQSR